MVDRAPLRLLRRHVGNSADDVAVRGQRASRLARGLKDADAVLTQFREPEVEHFYAAFWRDHHVGRLQIAMGDALLMRGADGIRQRNGDLQELVELESMFGN